MQNKKIQDVSGLLKKIPKCKKEFKYDLIYNL